jgi:hypothetical protein
MVDVEGLKLPDWNAVLARDYHPWDRDHVTIDTVHQSIDACVDAAMGAIAR